VTQTLAPIDSGTDKRRTTRLVQALPIKVTGRDALHEPFVEETTTVMVSCHGCKYQSKYYVPKGSVVTVEIPQLTRKSPPRILPAKVIWVQRPRNAREILHIGLEFEVAGNVWDIPTPPKDWFLLPGDEAFVAEEPASAPAMTSVSATELVGVTASWDQSEIFVMSESEAQRASEFALEQQAAKDQTSSAPANGTGSSQPTLDAQILYAIDEAVNSSIARLSKSIFEEARKAHEANNEELYAKIKVTVDDAMSNRSAGKRTKSKKKN
jgi:PilZ domain